jgi:hypothetical protein
VSEGETWQQVMIEKSASAMKVADVANLGPAPRELTPGLHKYIKTMKPSWAVFWAFAAVISAVSYAGLLTSADTFSVGLIFGLAWVGGSIALAIWTGKRSARGRAALRSTLRDGEIRFARLDENRQTQHGSGMSKKYRYHAVFDVDGRKVPFVTWNDAMTMINRGQLVEVVYNPAVPDEIVPTFLLV